MGGVLPLYQNSPLHNQILQHVMHKTLHQEETQLQLLLLDYHPLPQKFLKVLQPMQMDLQQVLRQKEKADQQPY
jgi:protoheme ferro-lyase